MASSLTFTEISGGDLPATAPTGKGIMFLEETTGNPFLRNDSGVDTPMTPGGVDISFVTMIFAESFVNQVPTGLDATTQISFGPAQGTGSDPAQIDAAGTITLNEDVDALIVTVIVAFGRTGGVGTSEVFFRSLINGSPVGTPIFTKIDNANTQSITFINNHFALPSGTTLATEFVRDPAGNDSGDLISNTPTATGWTVASPSSTIVLTKVVTS